MRGPRQERLINGKDVRERAKTAETDEKGKSMKTENVDELQFNRRGALGMPRNRDHSLRPAHT